MPRAFVAIDLDDALRDALVGACDAVRSAAPGWAGEKWVPAGNLHVTVRFLGDVADEAVTPLGDAIAEAVAGTAAFALRVSGIRAVPSVRSARMLWADLAGDAGAADSLAAAVERAVAPYSPTEEPRPFRAHVTLVRARRTRYVPAEAIAAAEALLGDVVAALSVARVTLYSSTLTGKGPVYEALRIFPTGRA